MNWIWMWVFGLLILALAMTPANAVDWKGIQQYIDGQIEPWVLVERGFGQEVGTKFRSEFGCHLAGRLSSQQYQTEAMCFETAESAERVFPALRYVEGVRD